MYSSITEVHINLWNKGGGHALVRKQCGAALLIILLILGLAGASFFLAFIKVNGPLRAHQIETQVLLFEAREALLGFAVRHARLPRPAISATDGRESPAPCHDDASCTGLLPWVTLGLPQHDGIGFRLRYSVSTDFTAVPIDFSKAIATKTIQIRDANGVRYLEGHAGCARSSQCLPAIVWSTGEKNFGTTMTGQIYASSVEDNFDERNNDRATVNWIYRPIIADTSAYSGGEFDDQLTWVPLLPLINRITSGLPGPG